jgi:hypothetical protein
MKAERHYATRDRIVYKAVRREDVYPGGSDVIAKLRIKKGTEVNFPIDTNSDDKNRTLAAKVLGFYDLDGDKLDIKVADSRWLASFKYRVGRIARVGERRLHRPGYTCDRGVHFFSTFDGAVGYVLP